jgi:hypothetical protein
MNSFQKWREEFRSDLPQDDLICFSIYSEFQKGRIKEGMEILRRAQDPILSDPFLHHWLPEAALNQALKRSDDAAREFRERRE